MCSGSAVPVSKYKFGEFQLDRARFELLRKGRIVKLERIPMELLILLAEKDGNVVSRQEIAERLWGKDVFVDSEHGINTAIRKIRGVLHEDAERPRFVQTVLGKGYRFVAEKNGNARPLESPPELRTPELASPIPAKRRGWAPLAIAVLASCLLAAAILGFNVGGARDRIFSAASRPQIRSIAVLPLENLSGDPSQEYFADGMTDELITMLAKNASLRVVSRTSAAQYKGIRRPVRDIARELGVDGILEGSVARSANRVHMTVQLIHAPSDTHIWAESYDRDLNEAFSLPSELSQTVAKEVKIAVAPTRPQRYVNPEAHDAYLQGRYFSFAYNNARSQEYFEKAIQIQPDYAAAWSGLSDAYAVRAVAGISPAREVMGEATAAAIKAIELDDSLAEAHNSRAGLYFFSGWDLKSADAESQRALELNPNYAEAHHLRSYILAAMNRREEALQEQKRASEIDPLTKPWALGYSYILLRQYDSAISELRLRAQVQPQDSFVHLLLSEAYSFKGMPKESARELEERVRLVSNDKSAAAVRLAFDRGGEKALAEWGLNDVVTRARKGYVSPLALADAYAVLGRKAETLKYLEDAYREHTPPARIPAERAHLRFPAFGRTLSNDS